MKTHVFIVGSKGIPAQYGGFETFVENLTARKQSDEIVYHVSCMDNDEKHFNYNNADCFNIKLPLKGAPGRILHVSRVLKQVETWKKENMEYKTIVYILGCRIGPLLIPHAKILHKLGVKIYVNPDGLEWKRDKWNKLEKKFLKICERCLVVNSDLVICDSKNIEKYILETYKKMAGKTRYVAYGADVKQSVCPDERLDEWLSKNGVEKDKYYLIVGRFVPENNYETMISEFMNSNTQKPLVIISNVENNDFYSYLKEKTKFENDSRIKFVGTVYDQELLKKIREYAFAYIHGHEVGGTNPSLLEALASTSLNLLLNVEFNSEVAGNAAAYWGKERGSLSKLIDNADEDKIKITESGKRVIEEEFNWNKICASYEKIWSYDSL
jgi:rhamnosyltransferase